MFNWALKYVKAPVVSMAILGEPIGASILAFIILGEIPGRYVLIGGMIILIGIFTFNYVEITGRNKENQSFKRIA